MINKAPSSTSVVSDNNPSGYGQLVTFTATLTCSVSPTETVTFKYGGIVLGKALLSGNTAQLCRRQVLGRARTPSPASTAETVIARAAPHRFWVR